MERAKPIPIILNSELQKPSLTDFKQHKSKFGQNIKGSVALVRVDKDYAAVQKWVEDNVGQLKKTADSNSRGDASAMNDGRAAGHKVSLNKGMGGGSSGPVKLN